MLGEKAEKRLTKNLNENKNSEYWDILGIDPTDRDRTCAIHITRHKNAKLIGRKVKPKADVVLAKGDIENDYVEENDYYLKEGDKRILGLTYVEESGISVKKPGSDRYTITKMNPSTFEEVFGCTELGAGASIYCRRKKDVKKNRTVLNGWETNLDDFTEYFSSVDGVAKLRKEEVELGEKKKVYRRIKKKANRKIKKKIKNNEEIKEFIFKGEHNFKEPFTAQWIYQDGELEENGMMPFKVTTGSGRSRGDFTVVIKPRT